LSSHRVLVTCDAESEGVVTEELRQLQAVRLPGSWLDTGDAVQGSILLVETDQDFDRFSDDLERTGSIFVRHLCPVQYELPLHGTSSDIDTIRSLTPQLAIELDPGLSFSVQSRVLGTGKLPYRKVELNETLSDALEESTSAPMDCRWPQQVVSVLCTPTAAYLGVSYTSKNRSAWPGGRQRFKRDDAQVSRAEFKLLEALSVFGLELPRRGRALDIGAAPGGWARILATAGLQVDAVDPAELAASLLSDRRIVHFRKRIQDYRPGSKRFSAVVNDMKMDPRDSIDIMARFAPCLEPDGLAIMTLKMPRASTPQRTLGMVHDDLARLATSFEIVGARQLYHNRSEVTVAMRALQPSDARPGPS
jgi:23S rRNA (cytidine2498-2'-O)-methyltransferase